MAGGTLGETSVKAKKLKIIFCLLAPVLRALLKWQIKRHAIRALPLLLGCLTLAIHALYSRGNHRLRTAKVSRR